jgi:sphingolipid 8-(E)-desaturase
MSSRRQLNGPGHKFLEFTMATNNTRRKDILYSRRQVEGLIADGRTIIIVDQKILKVDSWLKYHPGGDKAIMHMVGRDATDELNA